MNTFPDPAEQLKGKSLKNGWCVGQNTLLLLAVAVSLPLAAFAEAPAPSAPPASTQASPTPGHIQSLLTGPIEIIKRYYATVKKMADGDSGGHPTPASKHLASNAPTHVEPGHIEPATLKDSSAHIQPASLAGPQPSAPKEKAAEKQDPALGFLSK